MVAMDEIIESIRFLLVSKSAEGATVPAHAGPLPNEGCAKCAVLAHLAVIYARASDYPQPKLKKKELEKFRRRIPAIAHFLNSVW